MKLPHINRKLLGLGIAIAIGVLSFWGFKSLFDQKVANLSKKGPQVHYVVASTNLQQGNIISTNNVSQRNLAQEYSQSNAVPVSDFGAIDGLPLKVDLKPGDIVMYSMVDNKKDISKLIPAGHRAITIPVDDESSISSMLKPGDLIDLLITLNGNQPLTVPLMQGVKVLATGKQLDGSMSDNTGYANITLDVSAIDARNITFAASLGKISATLRNPNDQNLTDTSSFMQLVNTTKTAAPISAPPSQKISSSRSSAPHHESSNLNIIYGNKDE
ncbi:Flp pilus assembly protein CpaB [Acinetobacter nectaris]|uniref:Flp pilus assembly protein CpaB n=1 Tax=Acinetobacter nectaris TaxID=1219382 RepID=UPI001F23AC4C|nr:Flp pilus assembly protein CpaB [Acinetobacter nectaris]MCF9047108.1 Flp pilus assembly protein CpaB [Acinetobacter nectaris]